MRLVLLITAAAFLFILLLWHACTKQKLFKKVTYEGVLLLERRTPTAVAGRKVTLKGCGHRLLFPGTVREHCSGNHVEIGNTVTGADGRFSITGKDSKTSWYFIFVDGGWHGADGIEVPTSASFPDTIFVRE
jgi:hypothetical protein